MIDVGNKTRILTAMSYAYLDAVNHISRYIGRNLFELRVTVNSFDSIDVTIGGVRMTGTKLLSDDSKKNPQTRAAEVTRLIANVVGVVVDRSFLKHPERIFPYVCDTFSPTHRYGSMSDAFSLSMQYPAGSPNAPVLLDQEIASYIWEVTDDDRTISSLNGISGSDLAPFGYVYRHIFQNIILRSIIVDESSVVFKDALHQIKTHNLGIPGLDAEEFASFIIMADMIVDDGGQKNGLFIPSLRSDSILFRTQVESHDLRLMVIEPASSLDVICGSGELIFEEY